jgi:hypothetical protein
MRSNKAGSLLPNSAPILSRGSPMPRLWVYTMVVLVACLIASIVIAAVKLI